MEEISEEKEEARRSSTKVTAERWNDCNQSRCNYVSLKNVI